MRHIKRNRNVKLVVATGLTLSVGVFLLPTKPCGKLAWLDGPCEGGLHKCEKNGKLTCDCPVPAKDSIPSEDGHAYNLNYKGTEYILFVPLLPQA